MSTDRKFSKSQVSKIVQTDGSFDFQLDNLGKKTNATIPLARDNLPGLVGNLTSKTINKFERKLSEKGTLRVGKGFTLF